MTTKWSCWIPPALFWCLLPASAAADPISLGSYREVTAFAGVLRVPTPYSTYEHVISDFTFTLAPTGEAAVPEPASLVLASTALSGLFAARGRIRLS